MANNDPVNHPAHYTQGKIEVIDFIEDQGLDYHLGQVVKYVARAGRKDPEKYVEDLKKAAWYLARRIQRAELTEQTRQATGFGPKFTRVPGTIDGPTR